MPILLIVAALVAWFVFGFGADDRRAAAPAVVTVPGRGLVLAPDRYHQCYVEAHVNGASLKFLVDTGASTVAFGPAHLGVLGIGPGTLAYDQRVTTANGIGRAANIRIRRLEVAGLVLRDVAAQVDEHGTEALLGASVLRHFKLEFGHEGCVLTARGDD